MLIAAAGVDPAFDTALSAVYCRLARAGNAELTAALRYLSRYIELVDSRSAPRIAVLVGSIAVHGADPRPAVPPILSCLKTVAEAARYFAGAWREAAGTPPPAGLPDERWPGTVSAALGDSTEVAVDAWWALPLWLAAARDVLPASPGDVGLPGADVHRVREALDAVEPHLRSPSARRSCRDVGSRLAIATVAP